jgi:hypothetical protein
MVPQFKYQPELPYFQILVPTADTTRYAFLLKTCLEVRTNDDSSPALPANYYAANLMVHTYDPGAYRRHTC